MFSAKLFAIISAVLVVAVNGSPVDPAGGQPQGNQPQGNQPQGDKSQTTVRHPHGPPDVGDGETQILTSFLSRRPGQPSVIATTPPSARPSPSAPTCARLSPTISRKKSRVSNSVDSRNAKSIRTLTLPPPRRDGSSDAHVPSLFWYRRDAGCTQDPHTLPLTDTVPDSFFNAPYFKCSS